MREQVLIDIGHPVMQHHQVHGAHLLSGPAYIDLLYQLFQGHGHDRRTLELRDLTIFRPLMVSREHSVLVRIDAEQGAGGAWSIAVTGQDQRASGPAAWNRYVTAQVHPSPPCEFDEVIDLEAIQAAAIAREPLTEIYRRLRTTHLVHGDFMMAQGMQYLTADAIYADCALGDAALPSAAATLFHPTLLDAAVLCTGGHAALPRADAEPRQALRIPIYFQSFRASAALQSRCCARVKLDALRTHGDLGYSTVDFFDAAGHKVAQLTQFVSKCVRDPAALHDHRTLRAQSQPAPRSHLPDPGSLGLAPADAVMPQDLACMERLVCDTIAAAADCCHDVQLVAQRRFHELGLTSAQLLELAQVLGARLGRSLSPTLLFEHASIGELASHLLEEGGRAAPSERTAGGTERAARPQRSTQTQDAEPRDAIAIVGLVGRFPKARTLEEFWSNLQAGRDCIEEIPAERWDHGAVFPTERGALGKTHCRWGGFIEGVAAFDPLFFRIPPRDAELMDPQSRLFLQSVWELLERAGYTRARLQGEHRSKVGVYVGSMYQHYQAPDADVAANAATSLQSYGAIANRVSYLFGLNGPSLAVDTACASATTAVHLACRDLRYGTCELAIAGGVNLSVHPRKYVGLGQMQMLGSSPASRSFSEADGYLPAEAVGAVLLKPLPAALRDGDRILALIRGSSVNHGGAANSYTTPNLAAQVQLMRDALEDACVEPQTVSYVEAAANGSALGDAMEIIALKQVLGAERSHSCAVGTVKSNIGHAEAASGMSQLAKVVLQLQHRTLAASIKTEPLNRNIDLRGAPLHIQKDTAQWQRCVDAEGRELPRRALLNSFGAGGAYASLVLEEFMAPPAHAAAPAQSAWILPLSARSPERLRVLAARLLEHLEMHAEVALSDVACTLQLGREAMECRLAIVASSRPALLGALRAFLAGQGTANDGLSALYLGEVADGHAQPVQPTLHTQSEQHMLGDAQPVTLEVLNEHARRWSAGAAVPWRALHAGGCTILLPTYPFAEERYWLRNAPRARRAVADRGRAATPDTQQLSVRGWLSRFISQTLGVPAERVDLSKSFQAYGIDSLVGIHLRYELQKLFGVEVTAAMLLENPTLELLARYLEAQTSATHATGEAAGAAMQAPEVNRAVPESEVALQILEQFKAGKLQETDIEALVAQGSFA